MGEYWPEAEGFFFTVYTRALASNIRYYSLYHGSGQGEITLPYIFLSFALPEQPHKAV
jgi:hypothetical protein